MANSPPTRARSSKVWEAAKTKGQPRPRKIPKAWVGDTFLLVTAIMVVAAVGFSLSQDSLSSLSSPSGILDVVGRASGMAGTVLMVVMVMMAIRLPVLERSVGQDRLIRWHRTLGGWPIVLIAVHIGAITWGYATASHNGVIHQFLTFVFHAPDIFMATVAFLLLVMAGVTSYRQVRRKMKYETWWAVHLYLYLALGLAVAHQIRTGIMFMYSPTSQKVWVELWIAVALVALSSRVLLPLGRNLILGLRVSSVKEVAPDVFAITVKGRRVGKLAVDGGQFFQWRFASPGLLWHSHPYSISAMPRPPYLRVTIKALGDQSTAVRHLAPGTRVFVEGPYGSFTRHALQSRDVTLIGAGVGMTPLRALLEDLPVKVKPTVIVRARTMEDLVHHDEIAALVARRGGVLHELIGTRHQVPLNAPRLHQLVPQLGNSDVYVCGPSEFSASVLRALDSLRVPAGRIHCEEFSF